MTRHVTKGFAGMIVGALICLSCFHLARASTGTDPAIPSADTVFSLYHSGAFFCAGIVAVYLIGRWAAGDVGWLKDPVHAHYVTAILAALAVIAIPASQGTTPNMSMLLTAAGTLLATLLPNALQPATKPVVADNRPPGPSGSAPGFIRPAALFALGSIAIAFALGVACGGPQTPSGQLATCTETAAVKQLEPVVQSIAESGIADIKGLMSALAVGFGTAEVDCVASFVEAELKAKLGAAPETQAAIARLDEWLHRAR